MSDGHEIEFDDGCGGNAAPYVLGALSESEYEAFVAHLETCAVCREEVAALQTVAETLPAAVPEVPAPPELKRRLMADVNADARGSSRARSDSPEPTHEHERRSWLPVLAPIAMGVALIAVLAVVLLPGGPRAPRVIRAQVSPAGSRAVLRIDGSRGEMTLSGMPPTEPGRTYEVWVRRGGAPQPTDALFSPTSAGTATVAVPGTMKGVRQVLVTSEPLGGSSVPTRAPVVVASVT